MLLSKQKISYLSVWQTWIYSVAKQEAMSLQNFPSSWWLAHPWQERTTKTQRATL